MILFDMELVACGAHRRGDVVYNRSFGADLTSPPVASAYVGYPMVAFEAVTTLLGLFAEKAWGFFRPAHISEYSTR